MNGYFFRRIMDTPVRSIAQVSEESSARIIIIIIIIVIISQRVTS